MLTGEQENNGPPAPERAEDGHFFVSASVALTKSSVDVEPPSRPHKSSP